MGPRPIGRGNYHHLLVRGQGVKASMGPRPIGRGNVTDTVQYLTGPGPLQWGRDRSVAEIHKVYGHAGAEEACFNGAATDRSRKYTKSTDTRGRKRHASMGPRPIGRGNPRIVLRQAHHELSSMGPRPMGRGNEGQSPPNCAW